MSINRAKFVEFRLLNDCFVFSFFRKNLFNSSLNYIHVRKCRLKMQLTVLSDRRSFQCSQ